MHQIYSKYWNTLIVDLLDTEAENNLACFQNNSITKSEMLTTDETESALKK